MHRVQLTDLNWKSARAIAADAPHAAWRAPRPAEGALDGYGSRSTRGSLPLGVLGQHLGRVVGAGHMAIRDTEVMSGAEPSEGMAVMMM